MSGGKGFRTELNEDQHEEVGTPAVRAEEREEGAHCKRTYAERPLELMIAQKGMPRQHPAGMPIAMV